MKKEKGITLIALVITIIVLLILAAVSITALTDEDKGVVTKAKQSAQKTEDAADKEDEDIKEIMDYVDSEDWGNEVIHSGTIPKNGIYYVNASYMGSGSELSNIDFSSGATIYTEGQAFPEPQTGDLYIYEDYAYAYNAYKSDSYNAYEWDRDTTMNGWGIRVMDTTKTEYSEIIKTINGKNIVSLEGSFLNCKNLVKTPSIPETVINMRSAFSGCSSLSKVTNVPENVNEINYCFTACTSLTTTPTLPNTLTNLSYAFWGCSSLKTVTNFPNSVTSIYFTFNGCTSLENVPTVPSTVTDMTSAFYNNISLNKIQIDATPTQYGGCFDLHETGENLTISGASENLSILAGTNDSTYRTITVE